MFTLSALLKTSSKHKYTQQEIVQKKKKTLNALALIKRPSKESLAGSGNKSSRHEQESDDEKPSTSGQVKIKQEVDKEMDSSDSSDDEVLCKKEIAQPETKRKAEVLSKESGKIGITIKTSPPSSAAPVVVSNVVKEEKLKREQEMMVTNVPESKPADSSSGSSEAKKVKKSPSTTETPEEKVTSTVTTNNKEVSSSPVSQPVKAKEDSKPSSTTVPSESTTKEEKLPPMTTKNQSENKPKPLETPSQPTPELTTPKKQTITTVTSAEPTSPYHELASPRLWLPKFNLSDQIFITDVTVNSETATIRECKTEKGFFKERTAINSQVESIPVTQP